MPDVHDRATRSRNMAAVRGKDTKPELLIRRGLHGLGLRYRLQGKDLPGKPDLVFPKYKAVVFVHGCFWHGHDCPLFRLPGTRTEFWRTKISSNVLRDHKAHTALQAQGWRTATVWECALKGRKSLPLPDLLADISSWLQSAQPAAVFAGSAAGEGPAPDLGLDSQRPLPP